MLISIGLDWILPASFERASGSSKHIYRQADVGKSWSILVVCCGILSLFFITHMVAYDSYLIAVMTWINVVLFNALVNL